MLLPATHATLARMMRITMWICKCHYGKERPMPGTFSLMGLPVKSVITWEKLVAWLGKHVGALAKSSCEQVQKKITDRGDKLQWIASYDGFYLTRGQYSNNSSATLHDYTTNSMA